MKRIAGWRAGNCTLHLRIGAAQRAGKLRIGRVRRLITKVIAAAALLVAAGGCSRGPKRAPVLAEAFVGPAVLKIRSDIPLESAPVATVKHGERLEIVGAGGGFCGCGRASGAEGWTDERQLLGSERHGGPAGPGRRAPRRCHRKASRRRIGDLNVHTQPASVDRRVSCG